jgi:hypothetical protein
LNRQQLHSNHLPSQFLSTDIDQDTLTVILMSTADVGDRLHGMVQHSVGSCWILERSTLSLLFNTETCMFYPAVTVSWWDSCRYLGTCCHCQEYSLVLIFFGRLSFQYQIVLCHISIRHEGGKRRLLHHSQVQLERAWCFSILVCFINWF